MGVLNVTPDSFADGGRFFSASQAIAEGLRMREQGADLVDVGGESTRPGAPSVPLAEEMRRVIPVVEQLAKAGVRVSVDTLKSELMRAAIDAGCAVVNDVNGFRAEGAIEAVAQADVGVVAMHMQGTPATMQHAPEYGDVVAEVGEFLVARAQALEEAGVAHSRIVIDPGFGFGKTHAHNVELFRGLPKLAALGYPLMVGLSRKKLVGDFTGRPSAERAAGSIAAALLAVQNGARIVRVHDVRETVDAINVWMGLA